ncbi:RagB/SusD family nutrient uptake outer membrane protein [uncultured Nonlabens sp.]|uniref:RagB/SusD family nutrient uptake outer membrane protein n=1 Tax=uncultured Nonlabens sp. TaxID=859306 RepID=UPI00260C4B30|nr:RagB/SusD family nutrient uptake outer membrane protein [uncultured Nonlabens sp.]
MKKIILTITAAAFLLYSCEDAQEIVQPSEFNFAAAFQNIDDLKTSTIAVYGAADNQDEIQFTSHFTDECALGNSAASGSAAARLQLNVGDFFAEEIWANNYLTILNANIVLLGSNEITPADATEQALFDESIGEAYALRAYAHLKLLAYFGEDLSDRNSAGIINVDFVPSIEDVLPRNTVGESIDFINDDLDEAERLLTNAGTGYSPIFVSVDFVRALRARANAYVGNYGAAVTAANNVLSNFSLPTAADSDSYGNLWEDVYTLTSTNQEVIFRFNATENNGNSIGQIYNTNASTAAGAPLYEMSRNLFNQLELNEANFGDIRRQIYIDPTSIIAADYPSTTDPREDDLLVVDKYPGDVSIPSLVGGYTNDQKVIRTVEMHFILAEAAIVNGDLMEAAAQIKTIRDARYTIQQPAPVYSSAIDAWQDVLAERKIELFAEGHRYIDIKRLGSLANTGYDRNETDCSFVQGNECDLSFSDFRARALPIPAEEIRANAGIQQNPGY